MFRHRFASALHASAIHLLVSIFVSLLLAVLVFGVWYRWPLYELVGGRELFWLVMGVDIICGPILTLILWNPQKPKKELFLDLCIVAVLQVIALGYGVYTVSIARPIFLVFEKDRIRVITASEVDASELSKAGDDVRNLSWTGPRLIGIREPVDSDELLKSVELSLNGKEPSLRPDWWQSYLKSLPQLLQKARAIRELVKAYPQRRDLIDRAIKESGLPESELIWLPMTSSRSAEWVVIFDKKGNPRAYLPLDGFINL